MDNVRQRVNARGSMEELEEPIVNPRPLSARSNSTASSHKAASSVFASTQDIVTCGRTKEGVVFIVPETKDIVHVSLDWRKSPSLIQRFAYACILLQVISHVFLFQSKYFAIFSYVFWRVAYNVGLGYLLNRQSDTMFVSTFIQDRLLGPKAKADVSSWIASQLKAYMGPQFEVTKYPGEFNSWILFRWFVDIILLNDFVAYCIFALYYLPQGLSFAMNDVFAWIRIGTGMFLIIFNVWVKVDAHRVVKDFAWYWGDFFFLIEQDLTFDGVFEMAPHPMYSVGYAWYYGFSLITKSYVVLFVSLFGHALQFLFLFLVEEPHIQKIYGNTNQRLQEQLRKHSLLYSGPMPYFRRDLVVFRNFDLCRSTDLFTLICLIQIAMTYFLNLSPIFYLGHALAWRCIHSIGLGFLLNEQSENMFLTRHFIKWGGDEREAFSHWKSIYNFSLIMTYGSFIVCACKFYYIPDAYYLPEVVLRHVFGIILILLHAWASVSVYEVLGDFGWFYGDFFIAKYRTELYYTGIYRFLNNPEKLIGQAAFWGIAVISNSSPVIMLALISHVVNIWFLERVEKPHMVSLYGDKMRDEAGAIKSVKSKVEHLTMVREARKLGEKAEMSLKNAVEPLVKERVVAPLENIIKPRLTQFVADTKAVLDETTSNLLNSLKSSSTTPPPPINCPNHQEYSVKPEKPVYCFGESIKVEWTASVNHSSKDRIMLVPVAAQNMLMVSISSKRYSISVPMNESSGTVIFSNMDLPWRLGKYEVKYVTGSGSLGTMLCKSSVDVDIVLKGSVKRIFSPITLSKEVLATDYNADAGAVDMESKPFLDDFADHLKEFLKSIWGNLMPGHLSSGSANLLNDVKDPVFLFPSMKLSTEQREIILARVVYCIEIKYGVEFDQSVLTVYPSIKELAKKIIDAKDILSRERDRIERRNSPESKDHKK